MLGEYIRRLRIRHQVSAESLAKRIGCSVTTISHCETARERVTLTRYWDRLTLALGADRDRLEVYSAFSLGMVCERLTEEELRAAAEFIVRRRKRRKN